MIENHAIGSFLSALNFVKIARNRALISLLSGLKFEKTVKIEQ